MKFASRAHVPDRPRTLHAVPSPTPAPVEGRGGTGTSPGPNVPLVGYLDVIPVFLMAPLLLLLGVPALGYGIGAAAWILVRGLGGAVDRHAGGGADLATQLSLRIGYRFARVLVLVTATILALKGIGKTDGLTALLVITFAFSAQLASMLVLARRGRSAHSAIPTRAPVPGGADRSEAASTDLSPGPRPAA
jgi:hypothetical protein